MARLTTGERNAGNLSAGQKAAVDRKADSKLHPRVHALTMASADHLHRHGYIEPQQHQAIRGQAQAKMDSHKHTAPAFGALAPR